MKLEIYKTAEDNPLLDTDGYFVHSSREDNNQKSREGCIFRLDDSSLIGYIVSELEFFRNYKYPLPKKYTGMIFTALLKQLDENLSKWQSLYYKDKDSFKEKFKEEVVADIYGDAIASEYMEDSK